MKTMKTMIEVKDLCKNFGDEQILKGISLSIEEGEFVAVMGQSGSGKSTLLYNISGMDKASSGEILFDGKDMTDMKEEELEKMRLLKMGFIFQNSYLLKNLSIRDNIVLPGFHAGVQPREEVNQKAVALMERLEILNVAEHDIKKVSGGQLQRAAVCRALMNDPAVLFGDEPTGALNYSATGEVMDILNMVNQEGTTVMLVTHDARVAARADRVIFLVDGNVRDQIQLGKYGETREKDGKREEVLLQWLGERGF